MRSNAASLTAIFACGTLVSAVQLEGRGAGTDLDSEANPVQKVVNLMEEMKKQVEKEAEEDKAAYEKFHCWCTTNKDAKTEAVAATEKRIPQLEAFIEEAAGLHAQLATEITSLEGSIAEDQDALAKASGIRDKEYAEYYASEKDQMETIETMNEALKVLAKVQLLQKKKGVQGAVEETQPLLLQLRTSLKGINTHINTFRGVMQRDLWDMMSSIDDGVGTSGTPEFLKPSGSRMSAIEQHGSLSVGQSPEGLVGNAAGVSSYNSRSGGIYGMLGEMKEEFDRNLAADQKMEMQSLIAYQKLRAAKTAEISTAQASKAEKKQMLADSQSKAAQAKEDLAVTKDALSADQKFLLGLEENCGSHEEDFAERAKVRSEELVALAETIKILTTDDARDLYSKTMTFFQTGSIRRGAAFGRGRQAQAERERNQAVDTAMQRILGIAQKNKNWVFASLAVHVRLDKFTKVKEAMDKMTAELTKQQKEEVEKKDFCNKQVDETEDSIKAKNNEKEDLEGKQLGLENSIASLESDLAELRADVAQMKVSLKEAGEDRSAENRVFQQAIMDQRATANILNKAKARLEKFYRNKVASLAQGSVHNGQPSAPGQPVAPPPPKSKAYSKSSGAGGVMQLLDMILTEAAKEETELLRTEQHAQKSYEAMVKDSNEAISANEAAIADKSKLASEAAAAKSEADAGLLTNENDRMKLAETLKGMHLDCDFILQYFDMRQQARREELDAIADAKAILSGANFQVDAEA